MITGAIVVSVNGEGIFGLLKLAHALAYCDVISPEKPKK